MEHAPVVIKNTFLDVADYKFLYSGEVCGSDRRSRSVPKGWKTPVASGETPKLPVRGMSNGSSTPSSDSFHSAVESLEVFSSTTSAMDLSSIWDWGDTETDAAVECATPTSNLSSPRFQTGDHFEQCSPIRNFICATPSPQNSPRCSDCHSCIGNFWDGGAARLPDGGADTKWCSMKVDVGNAYGQDTFSNIPEPENEPDTEHHGEAPDARTRLKVQAAAFQPVPKDTRMEAVISCINLALFSSGQAHNIKIENGVIWMSATVISAEVLPGHDAAARAYSVMQLTKTSLEAITSRLPTVALLSSRVQKEDGCYSLRASIACLPDHARNCMCWDLFRTGHCPRRSQ